MMANFIKSLFYKGLKMGGGVKTLPLRKESRELT